VIAVPRGTRRSQHPTTPNPLPEPFVERGQIVTTSSAKPAERDITSPSPPSHPLGSADLRILRAWVQAEQRQGAPACQRPLPTPTPHDPTRTERCESCRACQIHHTTVVSAVISAIDDSQARRVTRATLTDVYDLVPPHLRPFFGLEQGEGLKRLLGRWSKTAPHAFIPADVPERWQLTEAEAEVYWWHVRGWDIKSIQREMTPKEMRFDPKHWVAAEVAYALLATAGAKVRGLFGLTVAP
jgi:hypothetical protein